MVMNINQIFEQALIAHQEGRLEEAKEYYKKVININPNFSEAHNNIGIIFGEFKEFEKALASYKKAIELKPDYAKAYSNLGIILNRLGRTDEAETNFKKAIEIRPELAEAHNSLANVFKKNRRFEEAEVSYRKAIELKPNYTEAFNNLGAILSELGKFNESEISYRKALKLKPDFSDTYYNLGILLTKLGRLEEAVETYRKMLDLSPAFEETHNNLGDILNKLGRFEEAEISFKKAIELKPNFLKAHDNLAVLLKQNKLLDVIKTTKLQEKKTKNYLDNINTNQYQPGIRLTSNPFISNRKVETELLTNLYKTNAKKLDDVDPGYLRYGNGRSSNYELFKNDISIIKDLEKDLTTIMSQAVKSDIFIMESFFNIFETGSGITSHNHINKFDQIKGLIDQKFSLTYYLDVGDQNCDEPGILKLYNPDEEILPSNGTIVIFPANRKHLAAYGGKTDRVMIGVNFYSLI